MDENVGWKDPHMLQRTGFFFSAAVAGAAHVGKPRRSLLGYPLRRAAAEELLHGGVRTDTLLHPPPVLRVSETESLPLPTLEEERADTQTEYTSLGRRMLPININQYGARDAAVIRAEDLLRRHKNTPKFHPHPSQLSVTAGPPHQSDDPRGSRDTSGRGGGRRFMPLQMLKPLSPTVSYAAKQTGRRPAYGDLRGELKDGRGLGERAKQRSLWQQDFNTKRDIDYLDRGGEPSWRHSRSNSA